MELSATELLEQLAAAGASIKFEGGRVVSCETDTMTFGGWSRRWLEVYHKGRIKDNTYWGNYYEPVTIHLIPCFGHKVLDEIAPIDIQEFFKEKVTTSALESLKKMKGCLDGIFETAIENNYCRKNPVTKTLRLYSKVPPKGKQTWSQGDYDRAWTFAKEHGYISVMAIMETGITRSELLGLARGDWESNSKILHLNNGLVHLKSSATLKMTLVHDGLKNQYRKRSIPVSAELGRQLDAMLADPGRKQESLFLFCAPRGGPYVPSNWYHRIFRKFIDELQSAHPDIPTLSPHELRHTRATLLKNEGVDLYTIARLLGHADLKMLMHRYVHDDTETLRMALGL